MTKERQRSSKAKPPASKGVRSRVSAEAGRELSDEERMLWERVIAARRNPARDNMRPADYARWSVNAYLHTGNGWHIVNAFLALHRAGIPIPSNILNWIASAFEAMERGTRDPLRLAQTRRKAQQQLAKLMMLASVNTVVRLDKAGKVEAYEKRNQSYAKRQAEIAARRKRGLKPIRKARRTNEAAVVRTVAKDFGVAESTLEASWKEHKRRMRER